MRRSFSFGNAVGRKVTAVAVALVVVGSAMLSQAATVVDSVSFMTTDGDGNFQKPTGLLTGGNLDQLRDDAAPGPTGASLRGWRDNTQTFTVSASDYAFGVDVTKFVINFRNRDANNNPDFGVRLFRVDDTNPLTADGPDLVFNPVEGTGTLKYPSLASAGVDGTYIFNFHSTVTLTPGVYAWQFLTSGTGTNSSSANPVWWVTTLDNEGAYPGGAFYQSDTVGGTGGDMVPFNGRDAAFGLIGTAAVPEPGSLLLLGCGVLAAAVLRRRMTK